MQERSSDRSDSATRFTDPSARPARVLYNPAVQRRLYGFEDSRTGPRQNAFSPQQAHITKEQAISLTKYSRYRNRAMWAQALVLFNVVGLPLSQGVCLEYYFTSQHSNSSLMALSIIPGAQIVSIMSMPGIVGWFYYWGGYRSGWKIAFFLAGAIAVCAQLPLQWASSIGLALILQGPVLGIALGTLFTLSTLVLSSHYRYNLPLVSMQSGFMGFLGAVVYAFVARQLLAPYNYYAPAATTSIMAVTLIVAIVLLHSIKGDAIRPQTQLKLQLPQNPRAILKENGTLFFISGYILTFFSIFTFPVFLVLILTQPPTFIPPVLAALALIACLSTAAISASISANPIVRRHIGPVNTVIAACILAGAASILPVFTPYFSFALVAAGVYGISMGAILALHIKATTVFHAEMVVWHPDMPARTVITMALAGLSAFAGLLVSAVLMENVEHGVKVAFGIAGGCLVCGGGLIGVGRWRRCRGLGVAI